MLRRGANVNTRDEDGETPLLRAARSGHEGVLQVLLNAGADPCAVDEDGRTALHLAAAKNHFLLVRRFLEIGLSPNQREWKYGETPLHMVDHFADNESLIRCRSTVRLLVKYGADIESNDNDGCTPLWSAMVHARPVVMEELIRAGAEVNPPRALGQTLLFSCRNRGDLRKVKLLVASGTDVFVRDDDGGTMVHCTSNQPDLLRFMIAQGIDVNAQEHDGKTALHWAVLYDVMESVRILAENGADPTIRDEDGQTPIDIALAEGQAHTAHYLEEVVRVRPARQTPLDPTP